MAHHSSEPLPRDFLKSELEGIFDKPFKPGPTGKFPEGKLTDTDEGEIGITIGRREGRVVMDFGKPAAWIGFTADQADQLAESLRVQAVSLRLSL